MFLIHIIFLLFDEFIALTFLIRQVYWLQTALTLIYLKVFLLSLLKNTDSILVGVFLTLGNIFTPLWLLTCMISG